MLQSLTGSVMSELLENHCIQIPSDAPFLLEPS